MRVVECVCLIFVFAVASRGATVCEVLDRRVENNGKQIEVVGHLGGTIYAGFFVYEKELGTPCENRWIFSWPSALGLYFKGQEGVKLKAELGRYGANPVDLIIKGRLTTRSDYYIINLPWRPSRPLGKYSYGGVAAAIAVSGHQSKRIRE